MKKLLYYITIFAYCILPLSAKSTSFEVLCGTLIILTIFSFLFFWDDAYISLILISTYFLMGLKYPWLYVFVPLAVLKTTFLKAYRQVPLLFTGILLYYRPFYILERSGINTSYLSKSSKYITDKNLFVFILIGGLLAFFLGKLSAEYEDLNDDYKKTRDDSAELNYLLKDRNKLLKESQDFQIHNATLKERNRIAREIHDNAGHILSRCILLTGVLKTINKDPACESTIETLDTELNSCMNTIRSSVHNLKNDSVELKTTITELVKNFSKCTINSTYEVDSEPDIEIRYAIINTVKESLTNIAKHSNASLVNLSIIEHPAMYQIIIKDNGTITNGLFTNNHSNFSSGIGLTNISERIESLGGHVEFTNTDGFRTFAVIPKKISTTADKQA